MRNFLFNPKSRVLWLLAFLPLLISGCSFNVQTGNNSVSTSDVGGVLVSSDKGDHWKQLSALFNGSCPPDSIASVSVNNFYSDPSDSSAVYAATDQGLFYTYNVVRGWNKASGGLPQASVSNVTVDPKNKCVILAASGNKLFRSDDCSRNWTPIYTDNNQSVHVNAAAIDPQDDRNIYLGTSRGDIIKSLDGGLSWRTIQRLDDGVRDLLINPNDNKVIFAVTTKNSLYRFNGNAAIANLDDPKDLASRFDGANWIDLNSGLKDLPAGAIFRSLSLARDNSLFLATDKILLKSVDNGQSWTKLNLLTPEAETSINAAAVNPQDTKEVYYITKSTFYRSADGGQNWITRQVVTARPASSLLIDFNNPQVIYLGVQKVQ
jgi:photosystem II stability/assembly factor-like uncharacterized protein